jgi:hypothetical protein
MWVNMVELEEGPLRAPHSARSYVGALAGVAPPAVRLTARGTSRERAPGFRVDLSVPGRIGARGSGLFAAPSFLLSTVSSSKVRARSKIAAGSPSGISRRRSACTRRSCARRSGHPVAAPARRPELRSAGACDPWPWRGCPDDSPSSGSRRASVSAQRARRKADKRSDSPRGAAGQRKWIPHLRKRVRNSKARERKLRQWSTRVEAVRYSVGDTLRGLLANEAPGQYEVGQAIESLQALLAARSRETG